MGPDNNERWHEALFYQTTRPRYRPAPVGSLVSSWRLECTTVRLVVYHHLDLGDVVSHITPCSCRVVVALLPSKWMTAPCDAFPTPLPFQFRLFAIASPLFAGSANNVSYSCFLFLVPDGEYR